MKNKELIYNLKEMQELRLFCSNILKRDVKGKISSFQEIDLLSRINMSKKSITSVDLSNTMNIPKSAISRLVSKLIKKELLIKINSKEDKRIYYLELTDLGLEELNNAYLYYLEPLIKLKKSLNEEEFNKLMELIKLSNLESRELKDESI